MYARILKTSEEFVGNEFYKLVTFQIPSREWKDFPEICEMSLTEYSPDRSVDQNAKYWSLVGEIAKIMAVSKTEVHNQLLNDYGELEIKDGNYVEVIMPEEYDYLSDKDLHLFPTGEYVNVDGSIYVRYWKLIDSKHLNKKQFSRLIQGAEYERSSLDEV